MAALVVAQHLKSNHRTVILQALSCKVAARLVSVASWRFGTKESPLDALMLAELPESMNGLSGLIGSDVLSRHGAVAIDYTVGYVVLGSPSS
jgi:hypothetical protein